MAGHRTETLTGPVVFGLFVIAGMGFIGTAKLLMLGPVLVTGLPVAMMLIYAGCLMAFRRLRLRSDQAGDNLYYMGFLFTLTSLGVSLYQFTADGSADDIIRNFGIALGSTIAGVLLRVMFNQMRPDPVEVEHVARIEMSNAARRLRRELDDTVRELSHFRRATEQVMAEGFDEILTTTRTVSERLLAEITETSQRVAQPLEAASQSSRATLDTLTTRVSDTLGGAARKLADDTDGLSANAGRVSSSLAATAERLTAMQTPEQVIQIRLEPAVEALAAAARSVGASTRENTEALATVLARSDAQTAARDADVARRDEDRDALISRLEATLGQTAAALTALNTQSETQARRHEAEAARIMGAVSGLAATTAADRARDAARDDARDALLREVAAVMQATSQRVVALAARADSQSAETVAMFETIQSVRGRLDALQAERAADDAAQ